MKKKLFIIALALVMCCSLVAVVAINGDSTANAAGETATITIKLGDGVTHNELTDDISVTVNQGNLVLNQDTVRNTLFAGKAPVVTADASQLLFGLYVDADQSGAYNDGDTLYMRDDTIAISGDVTLNCYFDPELCFEVASWDNTQAALTKAWRVKENAKQTYTARDLQPLFHNMYKVDNSAFATNTPWGDDVVRNIELPATVYEIGWQGLAGIKQLESMTFENIEVIAHYGVNNSGWHYQGGAETERQTFVFKKITWIKNNAFDSQNGVQIRNFVIAGTKNVEEAKLHKILSGYGDGSAASDIFGVSKGTSAATPRVTAYVPYGKTASYFPLEADLASTGFANHEVTNGDTVTTYYNAVMREMHVVSFNLDGGAINGATSIADQYIDARAVSVVYGDKEVNVNDGTDATRSTNKAAQDLSLLGATKPANPTKAGMAFVGWQDQNGEMWTDADWAAGGKAGDYQGAVQLKAVYAEVSTLTIKLNGGDHDGKISDVVIDAPKADVELSHEAVRSMLSNKPILHLEDTSKILTGLFVDTDEDGEWDEGETMYKSGDTLPLAEGALTLTCYYDPELRYEEITNSMGKEVKLLKVFRSNANAIKEVYTARDLQPLYAKLISISSSGGGAFSTGGSSWDTTPVREIELPDSVYELEAYALQGTKYLEKINLENITKFAHRALYNSGWEWRTAADKYQTLVLNDKITQLDSEAFGSEEGAPIRNYILTGSNASDPSGYLAGKDVFTKSTGTNASAPRAIVYVPYGDTAVWYPKDITGTSFSVRDTSDLVTLVNAIMREMYTVKFDLNGGTIADSSVLAMQYMDARAVSVIRGDVEVNVNDGSDATRSVNPAAQTPGMLKAVKPAVDPTMDGKVFIGWADQLGNVWTDADWAAGGKIADYGTGEVVLKAVYGTHVDAVAKDCDTDGVAEHYTATIDESTVYFTAEKVATTLEALTTAKGHVVVVDDAVAATCTATGLTEGSHCSACEEVLVAQQVVEKAAHTDETIPAVAATCTATGLTAGVKCSVCDEITTAQQVVEKLAHTEEIDAAVAATCSKTGLTEGKHCSVCDTVIVAQEEVAKIAHTEAIDAAVAATCTATGLTEGKHCSVCEEVIVAQQTVAKVAHTEETIPGKEATRKEEGLTEGKKCSVCGEILVAQEAIPATGGCKGSISFASVAVLVVLAAIVVATKVIVDKKRASKSAK